MSTYLDLVRNLRPFTFGFDKMFDQVLQMPVTTSYPPYNTYKSDNGYKIAIALAGFKKSDINVEHDKELGRLIISGKSKTEIPEGMTVLKQGIASREFLLQFNMADTLKVDRAELKDGVLEIDIIEPKRIIEKPLSIPVI